MDTSPEIGSSSPAAMAGTADPSIAATAAAPTQADARPAPESFWMRVISNYFHPPESRQTAPLALTAVQFQSEIGSACDPAETTKPILHMQLRIIRAYSVLS